MTPTLALLFALSVPPRPVPVLIPARPGSRLLAPEHERHRVVARLGGEVLGPLAARVAAAHLERVAVQLVDGPQLPGAVVGGERQVPGLLAGGELERRRVLAA